MDMVGIDSREERDGIEEKMKHRKIKCKDRKKGKKNRKKTYRG